MKIAEFLTSIKLTRNMPLIANMSAYHSAMVSYRMYGMKKFVLFYGKNRRGEKLAKQKSDPIRLRAQANDSLLQFQRETPS